MAGPDELVAQLQGLQLRTMRTSPYVARKMGEAFQDRLVNVTLRMYIHPEDVATQAPAGGPPAWRTGDLARSVRMRVSGGVSTSRAWVGPTVFYASVQEFGKENITPSHFKYMRWYMDGVYGAEGGPWWYKKRVDIPERPFMRTTRDWMIADGSLHRAAVTAFLEGMTY